MCGHLLSAGSALSDHSLAPCIHAPYGTLTVPAGRLGCVLCVVCCLALLLLLLLMLLLFAAVATAAAALLQAIAQQFYQAYFLPLLQDVFAVLTGVCRESPSTRGSLRPRAEKSYRKIKKRG